MSVSVNVIYPRITYHLFLKTSEHNVDNDTVEWKIQHVYHNITGTSIIREEERTTSEGLIDPVVNHNTSLPNYKLILLRY